MRIPPPGQLRLPRHTLLDDVARRLAARHPELADIIRDPADPGWILLEQAAWMVESLSERLDQLPRHSIQHLLSLMGHELQEATPSLTVALLSVPHMGRLTPTEAQSARFFTRATEREDAIELCLIEAREVPLVAGQITALFRVSQEGGLVQCGELSKASGASALANFCISPVKFDPFSVEEIELPFPSELEGQVRAVLEEYRKAGHGQGWMTLEPLDKKGGDFIVRWRIALDSEGVFGEGLDDSERRSGVIARFPWRRLTFPDNSGVLEPQYSLRSEFVRAGLMVQSDGESLRVSSSTGRTEIEIGQHLSALVQILSPLSWHDVHRLHASLYVGARGMGAERPSGSVSTEIVRRLLSEDAEKQPWLESAVQDGLWESIRAKGPAYLVQIDLGDPYQTRGRQKNVAKDESHLRLGLLRYWQGRKSLDRNFVSWPLRTSSFTSTSETGKAAGERLRWHQGESFEASSLKPVMNFQWPALEGTEVAAPDEAVLRQEGHGRVLPLTLETYELAIPPGTNTMLIAIQDLQDGRQDLRAVMLNPVLMANAPRVADGRTHVLESSLQDGASLLWRNIVTRDTLAQLARLALPESVIQTLEELPLAEIGIPGRQLLLHNWEGVGISSPLGTITFNTGEEASTRLGLKRGEAVEFKWYRRTDGVRGNVKAGAIEVIEQPPDVSMRLRGVWNPLPSLYGKDPESVEAGMARLFGPARSLVPVVPADFERWAADELSPYGQTWMIRCWSEAERSLVSCAWWPTEGEADAMLQEARQMLVKAGGRALLLAIGRPFTTGEDPAFERARRYLMASWERIGARHPVLDTLVVIHLTSLTYLPADGRTLPISPASPRFSLKGLSGKLEDLNKTVRPVPTSAWHYLNAGIVACRREGRK